MDNPKVKIRNTKKYGKGIFAIKEIRKGEVIAEFDGPLLDDDFEPWTTDLQNHAIQCGAALWRDSKGLARYVNHSCDPNCGIKKLFKIVAMRKIKKGEQITWDYEMTEKSHWWRLKCRCGSPLCRGKIGSYKNLPLALRKKYKGYISEWLVDPKTARQLLNK